MPLVKRFNLIVIFVLACSNICGGTGFPIKRFVVPQDGMSPSLPAKSTFWVMEKPSLEMNIISRGDILVFTQEQDGESYYFVWRVIGLPDDQIIIKDTEIFVNGEKLSRGKVDETAESITYRENQGNLEYLVIYRKNPDPTKRFNLEVKVPPKEFFLMGDNRDLALDCRFTGPIPYENIVGKKIKQGIEP